MPNARTLPLVSGTEPYTGAVVIAGADVDTAIWKRAPTTAWGQIPRLNLPAGNTDSTLAHTRGGIISSTSAGNTSFLIKTLAAMGYTRNATSPMELCFLFQRIGVGPLFVNPDTGVTIYWNDRDPQYLTQYHPAVMLTLAGPNIWFGT